MQILFLWDTQGREEIDSAMQVIGDSRINESAKSAALEMARGAWAVREAADQRIGRLAPQWPPNRQPAVDRSLLRLAVWELTSTDTPPKVVIDEAIELAKTFSTGQSDAFVNGVLDAVLKEHQALLASGPPPAADDAASDNKAPANDI